MDKKEVQIQLEKEVQKSLVLRVLLAVKQGKILSRWAKENKISKQKLYYYTTILKSKGLIKKIGYGVWEASKRSTNSTKDTIELREVRGHAFIWKVKVPKIKNWEKRIEILDKLKIEYKLVGIKKTPRIILNKRKIWLGKKNIIIFEPLSFFAVNSIQSRSLAVYKLLQTLEKIETKLKIGLKPYRFTPRREHYSLIKNELAIQCNKRGEKIYVTDDVGLWFCIDNSYNLDEAETLNRNAMMNNMGAQGYFNSHKDTKWKVTPQFVLDTMDGIQQNQMIFDKNMKSHLDILKKLGEAVDELKEGIKKLRK